MSSPGRYEAIDGPLLSAENSLKNLQEESD
jgi:hypothetical protein